MVARRWNKREDDFASLDEYNDYLEAREDISEDLRVSTCVCLAQALRSAHSRRRLTTVFNLVNGVDLEETQAKVAANREQNKAIIQRNQLRKV